ncbi:SET domain-containing protein [Paraburkholderia aspalathi]|nr:SET domain-containing protein [Paraburkholderia aspalathi]
MEDGDRVFILTQRPIGAGEELFIEYLLVEQTLIRNFGKTGQ